MSKVFNRVNSVQTGQALPHLTLKMISVYGRSGTQGAFPRLLPQTWKHTVVYNVTIRCSINISSNLKKQPQTERTQRHLSRYSWSHCALSFTIFRSGKCVVCIINCNLFTLNLGLKVYSGCLCTPLFKLIFIRNIN